MQSNDSVRPIPSFSISPTEKDFSDIQPWRTPNLDELPVIRGGDALRIQGMASAAPCHIGSSAPVELVVAWAGVAGRGGLV